MISFRSKIKKISKFVWMGLLLTSGSASLHAAPPPTIETVPSKQWKMDSVQFERKDGETVIKGYLKLYPPYTQEFAQHLDVRLVGSRGETVAAKVDHIATVMHPKYPRTSNTASYEATFSSADVSKAVAVQLAYHAESHSYCAKRSRE